MPITSIIYLLSTLFVLKIFKRFRSTQFKGGVAIVMTTEPCYKRLSKSVKILSGGRFSLQTQQSRQRSRNALIKPLVGEDAILIVKESRTCALSWANNAREIKQSAD